MQFSWDLPGMPIYISIALILAYPIYKFKLLSISKSSHFDRMFFSHEQLFLYNLINSFYSYIYIFVLLSLSLIPLYKFSEDFLFYIIKIISFILLVQLIISIVYGLQKYDDIYSLLKKRKVFILLEKCKLIQKINKFYKNKTNTVIIICSFLSVLPFASIIAYSHDTKFLILIFEISLLSLISTMIFKFISNPLIKKTDEHYIFVDNNIHWYLIRNVNKDYFLIGNEYDEDKCSRTQLVTKDWFLNKDIIKERSSK